jgi:hypothetical protein
LLSTRDLSAAMALSDPSDSDSTLIVDQVVKKEKEQKSVIHAMTNDGLKCNANDIIYTEDELATLTNEPIILSVSENQDNRGPSPISDDSDVDSLHSFHYSPKAVDIPSAVVRLFFCLLLCFFRVNSFVTFFIATCEEIIYIRWL